MKKIISIIALIGCIANAGQAQEVRNDYRERVQFGFKGGVNYSNVYDEQGENFEADPKLGFAGGAFLSIPIGKYLGIQPELLFSQKGFQGSGRILGSEYTFTRTTNFVDIPLMITLKPTGFLSFMAGPQFSYLMSQRDKFTSAVVNTQQEQEFKNDNIRKNILCFIAGMDINVQHVVLGVRAGWDAQNNKGDGTSTTPRYKNVWYQATIGFRFYNN